MSNSVRFIIRKRVREAMASLELSAEQQAVILKAIEPSQGKSRMKVTPEGVWCNYFKKYMPKEAFKVTKDGKYPAFSREGEKLKRKEALLQRKMNEELANDLLQTGGKNKATILKKYKNKEA